MSPKSDLLHSIINDGRETLGIEFKRTMAWSDPTTKGTVLRCVLAMVNRRDGGILVFGMERKEGGNYEPVGATPDDVASFDVDDVPSFVNSRATPSVDLTVDSILLDERRFVVISVREFADIPVICTKDYVIDKKVIVTRGRMYCRSKRMVESTEVQTPEDLREILDLATEKALQRYFRLRSVERAYEGQNPERQFASQLGDI